MNESIYTYALIKSYHNKGQNYLDSFWPFALSVMPISGYTDIKFIQESLMAKYNFKIPQTVLKYILKRAKRLKYIEEKENKFQITKNGEEYLDKMETQEMIQRRINALVSDINLFFKARNITLSDDKIRNILDGFINQNIDTFMDYVNPDRVDSKCNFIINKKVESAMIDYIKKAKENKPTEYEIIKQMVFGSIIQVMLFSKDPAEISKIESSKFQSLKIYLDTNFIFSILEFRPKEISEPAIELFNLMKDFKFDVRVLNITIKELCWVVKGYTKNAHKYTSSIKVDDIYSHLKGRGWDKSDVHEFLINIEDDLQNMGIKIERIEINLRKYKSKNQEIADAIIEFKSKGIQKRPENANHDIAAIELIIEKRNGDVRSIENSKAIFLTSSVGLSKVNHEKMKHKEEGTICEVMLDLLFINLLWLRRPGIELPLKAIIATHSASLFVKKPIWDKFYSILEQIKQNNSAPEEKITSLLYHNHIEDVLLEFDDNETDKIDEEFLLGEMDNATKKIEEDVEKRVQEKIEEKDEEYSKKLELEKEKMAQDIKLEKTKIKENEKQFLDSLGEEIKEEKEVAIQDTITKVKENIEISSKKLAKKYSIIISILAICDISFSSFIMIIFGEQYGIIGLLVTFTAVLHNSNKRPLLMDNF